MTQVTWKSAQSGNQEMHMFGAVEILRWKTANGRE